MILLWVCCQTRHLLIEPFKRTHGLSLLLPLLSLQPAVFIITGVIIIILIIIIVTEYWLTTQDFLIFVVLSQYSSVRSLVSFLSCFLCTCVAFVFVYLCILAGFIVLCMLLSLHINKQELFCIISNINSIGNSSSAVRMTSTTVSAFRAALSSSIIV